MDRAQDDEVDELLHLFASKVAMHAVVLALDLRASSLTLSDGDVEHRLHLPRPLLAAGLTEMRRGVHPWEAGTPATEALARLMTVHLDESLATRCRHETGWWSYDGSFFNPVPPWEAWHDR